MNFVLQRSGHSGSGSGLASSFASCPGRRISGPQVGAIAVMSRGRRGGHVGVESGIDAQGNPIIISGNHGRRVGESTYPRGRSLRLRDAVSAAIVSEPGRRRGSPPPDFVWNDPPGAAFA